jgi:hypothetical protein
MKKSFLEKFIEKNSAAFNDETPSPLVWDRIEKNIGTAKPVKIIGINKRYQWIAAAVVIGILFTVLFSTINRNKKLVQENEVAKKNIDTQKILVTKIDTPVIQNLYPNEDVAENEAQENIYVNDNDIAKSIKAKLGTLKNITKNNSYLYQQFSGDLKVLEQTYQTLKKLSAVTPNRDVILKAMVQNLQLQAELLNRQLLITNKFENNKKQKNEKNTIQSL